MSALARTALRLAGIEALKADPVIAALCQGRIYDSRIESFSDSEPVPVIVVLTEQMEGHAWSDNNGGPPFDDHCELDLVIAMRAVVQVDGTLPAIATPETNGELEAALDLIEQRAVDAICVGDSAQSALVRRVARRVSRQKSSRFVDADTGIKLAERTVTLTAELKGEDQGDATELPDATVAVVVGAGNIGNGTLTLLSPATDRSVVAGEYIVDFTGPANFLVLGPRGLDLDWVAAQPFTEGVRFTLTPGSTPFAAGDRFTLTVGLGSFAGLPEPLRSVCHAMAPGSSGAAVCAMLAAAATGALPEFFTGADLTVAPRQSLGDEPPIGPGVTGAPDSFAVEVDILVAEMLEGDDGESLTGDSGETLTPA